ncbi:MAG TPA: HAMP domain-containing sensor histidine kinase [Kofleriaceae bacterium]|nr:HAMP domain-containing sensor histidine kinase [Kofleriaceae bacterium]
MRLRATILVKLLGALVLPAVALFTLFAFVAHEVSRRDLDDELGRRLEAIAASAASQIRGKYLVELAPGDEAMPPYQGAVRRLADFAKATGAHLAMFDRELNARGDSAGDMPIGKAYYRAELDRAELERVFERGETASSVTFTGQDGVIYKAGYAPVRASPEEEGSPIVLALSAQAPASYFARLEDLRERLFAWGAGLAAISILAAVVTTLFITRNVRRLAAAAERIGGGDLRERVRIESGDELGLLGQTMDRMRQQLADRDLRTQQMLAGIAHEVRNPLAGMTLFAGILRDEIPDGDERRGHVDKIQRELGYLERVVSDFLEYARRPRPELAPVPLGELLADVAQLASTDEIEVEVDPEAAPPAGPGLPTAQVDRGQLRRALLNLAKNAVQAASAAGHRGKGAVRLAARRRGDEVHLVVWNRGAAIPPEAAGRLFEPFFTTREKGTGLGLAFVREIAVDHGGRVDVASADGETTFTIAIPT